MQIIVRLIHIQMICLSIWLALVSIIDYNLPVVCMYTMCMYSRQKKFRYELVSDESDPIR